MKKAIKVLCSVPWCRDNPVKNTKQERKSHLNASSVNDECLKQPNRQKLTKRRNTFVLQLLKCENLLLVSVLYPHKWNFMYYITAHQSQETFYFRKFNSTFDFSHYSTDTCCQVKVTSTSDQRECLFKARHTELKTPVNNNYYLKAVFFSSSAGTWHRSFDWHQFTTINKNFNW